MTEGNDGPVAPKRRGLGRGLDALLGGSTLTAPSPTAAPSGPGHVDAGPTMTNPELNPGEIVPNPEQPRREFKDEELSALTESIRAHGVLHPLVVERRGEQWVLIAGERRLRAARRAGLTRVPVVVRPASESARQSLELALTENLVRADLTPLEEAMAYSRLADTFGLTHDAIALRVGKSRPAVSNMIRLLSLPAALQRAMADGSLSAGHARALLALPTQGAQELAAQMVQAQNLSVRETEAYVQRELGTATAPTPSPAKASPPQRLSPDDEALRRGLEAAIGAKVDLVRKGQGGRLMIEFGSDEDLDSLYRSLGGQPL